MTASVGSIPHRFGAVGRSGSIALIERFWRTLKERLRLPFFRPLTQGALKARVGYAMLHYSFYRPQRALEGGTPRRSVLLLADRPPPGDVAASGFAG